jgi:hypothetical protein
MDSYIIHAVGRRSIAGQLVTSSPTGAGVVTVTNCARRAGCPRLPARYHKRELWFWWWHLLLMGSESWTHAHVRWGSPWLGTALYSRPESRLRRTRRRSQASVCPGSNVLEGNRHRDVSTSRKSQYATIDRRTNVRRAEGLSTLGGHCRERACAYAKNARRRAKGNAWLSENPGNDLGRSTGRHDVVVRAAPSGDANSTENRRPIRQMPDSLRNLPTVLRPDTRVSE